MVESGQHGRLMAEVAGEVDDAHPGVFLHQLVQHLATVVAAAVVDKQQLKIGGVAETVHHCGYLLVKERQNRFLVVNRHDDGV